MTRDELEEKIKNNEDIWCYYVAEHEISNLRDEYDFKNYKIFSKDLIFGNILMWLFYESLVSCIVLQIIFGFDYIGIIFFFLSAINITVCDFKRKKGNGE